MYFYSFIDVKDKNDGILKGRPSRGVAILWNKFLNLNIKEIKINDRMLGINIAIDNENIILLNVYMPCDMRDDESRDEYRSCIAILENLLDDIDTNRIIIAGDFNADYFKKTRFCKELNLLTNNYNLKRITSILSKDDFTYLCPSSGATSLIDHVFCSNNVHNLINNVKILYDYSLFDHFPIQFCLNIDVVKFKNINNNDNDNNDLSVFIDWNNISKKDIEGYKYNLDKNLKNFNEDSYAVFNCTSFSCNDKNHHKEINDLYIFIVNLLLLTSLLLSKKCNGMFNKVIGWNDNVKKYYKVARNKFLSWKANGRPYNCQSYIDMKNSRKTFKKKLKECRKNKLKIKDEKLALSYNIKNNKLFWKQVRSRKNKKIETSEIIDNEQDPKIITEKFSNHFKNIFVDDSCFDSNLNTVNLEFNETDNFKCKISCDDVYKAINKLKPNTGNDNISSFHLKYGTNLFYLLLARFLSVCFQHAYLPSGITDGVIIPIIKNKFDDITSLNNYRPIIKSSIFLKVIEYIILSKINKYYKTNNRQLGFKKGSSTLTALFLLKETIFYYINKFTPVYAAFLDLSKAFDKVNHNILLLKLKNAGIPVFYLRLINFWYNNQNVFVNYNGNFSRTWKIRNGVRQGGVLSPIFFNIYIDDLINKVSSLSVGCRLGLLTSNIIAYADDIVVLAPSVIALQKILNVCYNETLNLCLKFNASKSYCIKFTKSNKYKQIDTNIRLGNSFIKFTKNTAYLGFNINFNLNISDDINRERKKFYKSFNSLFRKFFSINLEILLYLFKSHCNQFYGSELWYNTGGSSDATKQLSVGYHNALKKILNVQRWTRNHFVCNMLGLVTLNHTLKFNIIRFVHNIFHNSPSIVEINKAFFLNNSVLYLEANKILRADYGVEDILDNDLDALHSRVLFVHNEYFNNSDSFYDYYPS